MRVQCIHTICVGAFTSIAPWPLLTVIRQYRLHTTDGFVERVLQRWTSPLHTPLTYATHTTQSTVGAKIIKTHNGVPFLKHILSRARSARSCVCVRACICMSVCERAFLSYYMPHSLSLSHSSRGVNNLNIRSTTYTCRLRRQ